MLPVIDGGLTEVLQAYPPSPGLQLSLELACVGLVDTPLVALVAGTVVVQVDVPVPGGAEK